jgi:hypothetical protein
MSLGNGTVRSLADAFSQVFTTVISCAGDGAYVTGGTASFSAYVRDTLAAADQLKGTVEVVSAFGFANGKVAYFDAQNDKLKVLDLASSGAEQGAGDISASAFMITVFFK